jgi:serine/threonine protein kinase
MVCPSSLRINKVVLWCAQSKLWKLTNFDLTTEATSKVGRPTHYSRGTATYRAPELLRKNPIFTNKVDIWALGCILHELATLSLTFGSDWEVRECYTTDIFPAISVHASIEFLQHHILENIKELLHRDPRQRMRASDLHGIFCAYCFVLDTPVTECFQRVSYPTYVEWKQLVVELWNRSLKNDFLHFQSELLFQLAAFYQKKGEHGDFYLTKAQNFLRHLENYVSPNISAPYPSSSLIRPTPASAFIPPSDYNPVINPSMANREFRTTLPDVEIRHSRPGLGGQWTLIEECVTERRQ